MNTTNSSVPLTAALPRRVCMVQGNLKRTAWQCSIEHSSAEEILLRLKVCIQKCDYFRKNGKQYQQKHLNDCLARARDKEDSDIEQEILGIIQCKKDRSFWRQLNYMMGKPWRGSVQRVLVEDEEHGTLKEHVTQESFQKAIFENFDRKHFFLAGQLGLLLDRARPKALASLLVMVLVGQLGLLLDRAMPMKLAMIWDLLHLIL